MLWHPTFSIAHRGLDEQHQHLFSLCHRVSACASGQLGNEAFHAALQAFADYALEHMAFEETILRQSGFPGLEEHHAEHRAFGTQIRGYVEASAYGGANAQAMANLAWVWWRRHVLEEDMQFKSWLQQRLPKDCWQPV